MSDKKEKRYVMDTRMMKLRDVDEPDELNKLDDSQLADLAERSESTAAAARKVLDKRRRAADVAG